ncbi:glutathione S-transferase F8, chloroplastic-like [Humulus lupulus]|uniref:glutathione S-transferase F8, chloroplastic-like n=1 Tax=Humulus lupulus TaxID=3486 RepID=UPI002B4069C7|nr:glutathione S-transferase F8, chloroplastic-like [Humulus lupulus]
MASIKVHGTPLSTAFQRAVVFLHEKEVDYEFVPIDMRAGAHKQESFIFLNPFGQVPALEDGDLQLFESRAISKYIAEEYSEKGTQLIPFDSKKKATASVWMEVEAHQFEPVSSKLGWEILLKPMFGLTTDPTAVEENEAKLVKVLDVYEDRLSQSKYLGGDCFTLADLHHLPNLQCLLGTNLKSHFESRPRVKAWVDDITARPAWAKVLALIKH